VGACAEMPGDQFSLVYHVRVTYPCPSFRPSQSNLPHTWFPPLPHFTAPDLHKPSPQSPIPAPCSCSLCNGLLLSSSLQCIGTMPAATSKSTPQVKEKIGSYPISGQLVVSFIHIIPLFSFFGHRGRCRSSLGVLHSGTLR